MQGMMVRKATWVDKWATTFAFFILALLVAASLGVFLATPAHAATTFTVNSTGDDHDLDFPFGTFDGSSDGKCDVDSSTGGEQCTLRAAIQQANKKKGKDTIAFNIPGNGPHTISLSSVDLPSITKPLTIDGYTQPGATKNTIPLAKDGTNAVLKIELNGNDLASIGLFINTSNVVIKGLAINNFRGQGINFLGGTGHKAEGNFIGTDPSGTLPRPNDNSGVIFSTSTDGSTLGGTTPDKRNLISGNGSFGVFLQGGASGNMIQGNLIGTDKNGSALGNSGGVGFSPSAGPGNRILSNSIFSNGGLGIDLGFDGVTANDGDDPTTSKLDPDKDTGPNNLQNYPDITSAQVFNELFGKTTTITGELTSTPSTRKKKRTFTIQFFSSPAADPSGFGEGKTFLGQTKVTTDRNGVVTDANGDPGFTFTANGDLAGQYVTATATNNKTGDTSEFSNALQVPEPGAEG